MASITKHPRSRYYSARFTDARGVRVCRSTKQTHHKTAQAVADSWEKAARLALIHELTQSASVKILSDLMEQTGGTLQRETIEETLQKFLVVGAGATHANEVSVKRYRPVITSFLESLGADRVKASIESLTTGEIEAWHAGEVEKGKSPKTANFGLGIIRAALERPRRHGMIPNNPADAVNRFPNAGESRQAFTDEEIAQLLKVADTEWRGMIMFGAWAGVRLSDAASMTWSAIDFDKETLTFYPSKTQKTDKDPLEIALHGDVVAALRELPRGIGKAPIFPSLYGRKVGSHGGLSTAFSRLMVKAGIDRVAGKEKEGAGRRMSKKSFHSLRHTAVSRLANAGVAADIRKSISGHKSDQVHQGYTHIQLEAQRNALSKLPSLFNPESKKIRKAK